MADDIILVAEPRSERGSRPAGRLRREGSVPAVVYGLDTETLSIKVPARELTNALAKGANTLITLKLDGGEALTLARQVQRDPTRGDLQHVDFIRVRTDVAVAAEVPLHLIGEPEGVKSGGIVEQLIFNLSIEAKPGDIPSLIEHDISALEIGDQVRVAELTLPSGVAVMIDGEELVGQVVAPRVVEEEEPEGEEGEEGEGLEGEAAEGEEGEAPSGDSESPESPKDGED
jgi:large subunit ribosomal protein L25